MKFSSIIVAILLFGLLSVGTSNGQANNSNQDTSKDRQPKILEKPRVQYPQDGCKQKSAKVRLRITFNKSEKITNAEIIESSGCEKFDEKALAAANKIKFRPKIKDGEAVTVNGFVEYNY